MKQIITLALLVGGGLLAWLLADRLSSDALALATGLLFGLLAAGVPILLLLLTRPQERQDSKRDDKPDRPVYIVYSTHNYDNRQITVNTAAPFSMPPLIADRQREIQERQADPVFRVVGVHGEDDEW